MIIRHAHLTRSHDIATHERNRSDRTRSAPQRAESMRVSCVNVVVNVAANREPVNNSQTPRLSRSLTCHTDHVIWVQCCVYVCVCVVQSSTTLAQEWMGVYTHTLCERIMPIELEINIVNIPGIPLFLENLVINFGLSTSHLAPDFPALHSENNALAALHTYQRCWHFSRGMHALRVCVL